MVALTSQITLIVAALVAAAAASESRTARQASKCKGSSKCVPLSSCPALESLLRSPNTRDLIRLREALCDLSRTNMKVCCEPQITFGTNPPATAPSGGGKEGLLPERCGLSISSRRIFKGSIVPLGSYPWMAVLGYRISASSPLDWGCGGVLINDQYIVTAAHCVTPDLPLEEIRLGEHNLDTSPDCITNNGNSRASICAPRHQAFKVTRSSITMHPNYNRRSPISDDIALIRLERKATFNNFVNPICLPEENVSVRSFLGDRQAVVAGWGRTEDGPKSRIMKRVEIPLVELETCQPFYNNKLIPEQVCFGGIGQRDSCDGDSGGPVFQADVTGVKNYLIGLVSFGNRCGGDPAIYTKVASYRSWILENMRP